MGLTSLIWVINLFSNHPAPTIASPLLHWLDMNILIVEDSPTLRLGMKRLIEEIGHTPLFAESGEQALQYIGVKTFELVIMDVEMPGLNGFETTSLMREALGERWVPIIFATSHTSDESVLEGIEAGGDDYLIKPISRQLLEAKIKAMHRIAEMQQQLHRLNKKLAELSQRDGLTQLLNRRAFTERASQSIIQARRHARPSALLMLDVDFFKQYNDTYGHITGDECLQKMAQIFQSVMQREGDLIGRYGGEEFIILLSETDTDGAILMAERIREALAVQQIEHRSSTANKYVTLSIGIGIAAASNNDSLETTILSADKNLYKAKELGRNQIVATSESNHKTILIADKDQNNLARLTNILQPLGNIITAENKIECIEVAKNVKPDIIIIYDRELTAAEEIDLVLKQHVRTARTPVLFLSHGATQPNDNKNHMDTTNLCSKSLIERVTTLLN